MAAAVRLFVRPSHISLSLCLAMVCRTYGQWEASAAAVRGAYVTSSLTRWWYMCLCVCVSCDVAAAVMSWL